MSSPVRDEAPPVEQVAITLAPMRRRHLRSVLATERKVYPKPWTMALFLGELARPESRSYVIARSGAVVVGHAGVLFIAQTWVASMLVPDAGNLIANGDPGGTAFYDAARVGGGEWIAWLISTPPPSRAYVPRPG